MSTYDTRGLKLVNFIAISKASTAIISWKYRWWKPYYQKKIVEFDGDIDGGWEQTQSF